MKNNGFALIITMYVILVLGVLGITVAAFISGESIANVMTLNGIKAAHIAEGGIEYIWAKEIDKDINWSDSSGVSYNNVSLGEGEFDVSFEEATRDYCRILAVGHINRANPFLHIKRDVEVELSKTTSALFYSVAAGGGRINLNLSSGTLEGELRASGDIDTGDLTGDFTVSSYESLSLPQIDWDQYAAIASSDGNYIAGDFEFTSGNTYTGVYYVTGDIKIYDNVTIEGSVISRGSIELTQASNLFITPTSGYPALVADSAITGDLKGTQIEYSVINGLIYCTGDFTINIINSTTFNGALMVGGRLSMVNGSDFVLNYDESVQDTPFLIETGAITVESWKNL